MNTMRINVTVATR